jgi:hypothetical protein
MKDPRPEARPERARGEEDGVLLLAAGTCRGAEGEPLDRAEEEGGV